METLFYQSITSTSLDCNVASAGNYPNEWILSVNWRREMSDDCLHHRRANTVAEYLHVIPAIPVLKLVGCQSAAGIAIRQPQFLP